MNPLIYHRCFSRHVSNPQLDYHQADPPVGVPPFGATLFGASPLGLRNYQNYNWTCFEDLKDHCLTEPVEAAASEAKDVATAEPLTEAAVATAGA